MIVLTVDRDRLARDYAAALRSYLADSGEAALATAYELGRQAAASGIGVVELVSIHDEAVAASGSPDRATPFLLESLSPYEMSHRGFREACERLQAVNRSLEAANRELEAFSYSVSHDLRAPLRTMAAFAKALQEDLAERLDAASAEHIRRVLGAAARMSDLIDALLQLSRVGRGELDRQPIDVTAIATSVVDEIHKRDPWRSIGVAIQPDMVAHANERLTRIAYENLIGNAWKFTAKQQSPRITVGATAQDGETVFFVRDNGAGFDAAHANRLFAPFQRFHSEAEFAGTGIGLATVLRIVERHGGRIWADGSVGAGATFYFTLPSSEAIRSAREVTSSAE